jgi:hypothetical protein
MRDRLATSTTILTRFFRILICLSQYVLEEKYSTVLQPTVPYTSQRSHQPSLANDCPRDPTAHLSCICLFILHAKWMAKDLEYLTHGPVEVTYFPKESEE